MCNHRPVSFNYTPYARANGLKAMESGSNFGLKAAFWNSSHTYLCLSGSWKMRWSESSRVLSTSWEAHLYRAAWSQEGELWPFSKRLSSRNLNYKSSLPHWQNCLPLLERGLDLSLCGLRPLARSRGVGEGGCVSACYHDGELSSRNAVRGNHCWILVLFYKQAIRLYLRGAGHGGSRM